MKCVMILMLAAFLSACGTPNVSIKYADVPPSTLKECTRPVVVPERELTRQEVVSLWLKDRGNLLSCHSKHKVMSDYYSDMLKV